MSCDPLVENHWSRQSDLVLNWSRVYFPVLHPCSGLFSFLCINVNFCLAVKNRTCLKDMFKFTFLWVSQAKMKCLPAMFLLRSLASCSVAFILLLVFPYCVTLTDLELGYVGKVGFDFIETHLALCQECWKSLCPLN